MPENLFPLAVQFMLGHKWQVRLADIAVLADHDGVLEGRTTSNRIPTSTETSFRRDPFIFRPDPVRMT